MWHNCSKQCHWNWKPQCIVPAPSCAVYTESCGVKSSGAVQIMGGGGIGCWRWLAGVLYQVFIENSSRFFSLTHCNHTGHIQPGFNSLISFLFCSKKISLRFLKTQAHSRLDEFYMWWVCSLIEVENYRTSAESVWQHCSKANTEWWKFTPVLYVMLEWTQNKKLYFNNYSGVLCCVTQYWADLFQDV